MSDPTALARRLRDARTLAGLTQKQAASLLSMHRPTISEIEAGRRSVSSAELPRFAEIYDVSTAWLLGEASDEVYEDRVRLAARELSKMQPEDVDRLLDVLSTMRGG